MKPIRIKGLLILALSTWLGVLAPAHAEHQVVIVKSSDNAYFRETIDTLTTNSADEVVFRIVDAEQLASSIDVDDESLMLIALGSLAVEAVSRLAPRAASINAYITHEQFHRFELAGDATVLLDQPLARYLALCKILLDIDRVGVIVESDIDIDQATPGGPDKLALVLNQYRVDSHNKLLPVLRRLLQQEDALLMLPRQNIYNRDSLKGVLLTTYRNRKPAISYSPAHVKSGALASIFSSPRDIGRHLAEILDRWRLNPQDALPSLHFARYFSIATNTRVARALGLVLPEEAELRQRLDELVQ